MQFASDTLDHPQTAPASENQILFARRPASRNQAILPCEVQQDRRALSRWIEEQTQKVTSAPDQPTSKQVALAERLAHAKRRSVPNECFRSRELMSRWINSNLCRLQIPKKTTLSCFKQISANELAISE